MSSEKDRLELIKLRALTASKLLSCFVATDLNSKPAGQSKLIITDTEHRGHWIIGANRSGKCLVTGTLVATPSGPVPIEQLKSGDIVYDEFSKPIRVVGLHYQGKQAVGRLISNKKVIAEATYHHRWLLENGLVMSTATLCGDQIAKRRVICPLGPKSVIGAYALGAMLGDGCSRDSTKWFNIFSETDEIPNKIANELGAGVGRGSEDNYTWKIRPKDHNPISIPHYAAWCKNRYAHEKIADIEVLREWDRESLLKFVAGIIDTDGSVVVHRPKECLPRGRITLGMQAKSVVEAIKWAFLTLWQVDAGIHIDNRDRYKNGPVHILNVSNQEDVKTILRELAPYLIHRKGEGMLGPVLACKGRYTNKPFKTTIEHVPTTQDTWDIEVDSPTHLFLLANGYVSHNTSVGAREFAWWFLGTHPFKQRLPEWGEAPLLMLMVGRTSQLITEEIWANKLKPLLPPGSYKTPQKDGAFLKSVEHATNGNRILFLSHHDAKNAREKIQGFTAHVVWLDEMPDDSSFLSELILRVSASGKVEPGMTLSGYFYATFTPLVENENIKRIVDECTFPFKKWKLTLEDNPIFAGWDSSQLDDMIMALSGDDIEYRARRFGDWYYSSERVVRGYDPIRNRAPLPFPYSPNLQHALIVDPAASGKVGCTLWVLEPNPALAAPRWWCVRAITLDGAAASLLVPQVEMLVVRGARIGLRSRICDSSPSGFYKEAKLQGIEYVPVMDKGDTKLNSIEHINVAFFNRELMLVDSKDTDELHIENLQAKWKTDEKSIVNSHKYHCLDTTRYFWMKKPVVEKIEREYEDNYHALKQHAMANNAARASQASKMKQRSAIWGTTKHNARRR